MNWMDYARLKTGRTHLYPETLDDWQQLWTRLAGFTYHRLAPGQTLYQVAVQYQTSIRAVLTANSWLKGGPLQAGQTLVVPLAENVVCDRLPFDSAVQELYLQGLRARYPDLETVSLARTAENRTLWALRLGRGPRRLLLTAGFGEAGTGLPLWQLLERLLNGVRDDGACCGRACRDLVQLWELWLVPLAQPDGHPGPAETRALQLLTRKLRPETVGVWGQAPDYARWVEQTLSLPVTPLSPETVERLLGGA